jgi:hypothetical protein
MRTRITATLLKSAFLAAAVFGMSSPASAYWPFFWNNYSAYRPVYYGYGPAYSPCCSSGCSPCSSGCSPCGSCSSCGSGGCGIQSYYAPSGGCSPCGYSACGCSPCGCSPCSGGCGTCSSGCGVNYAPDSNPVPDNSASSGDSASSSEKDRQTYAEEESTGNTSTEEAPAPVDDDFGPVNRDDTGAAADPFPSIDRTVRPAESGNEEEADPAPLNLDDGLTLRVSPTRHRVHAEARYRVPHMARLDVAPQSPWQPVREAHVASN